MRLVFFLASIGYFVLRPFHMVSAVVPIPIRMIVAGSFLAATSPEQQGG